MAQDWQTRATARPAQWGALAVGLRPFILRGYKKN